MIIPQASPRDDERGGRASTFSLGMNPNFKVPDEHDAHVTGAREQWMCARRSRSHLIVMINKTNRVVTLKGGGGGGDEKNVWGSVCTKKADAENRKTKKNKRKKKREKIRKKCKKNKRARADVMSEDEQNAR
ncbi:hypothetical protein BDN72DRAFT_878865 [Pluteus cervinus]|uniref:Uncharacterized protein n=1 Tax=Pluteus cervinus TaxID=181527 RepID=A0ACD3ASG4_9AGAR|nr:hypothetical protein BDN72DRAFT_878865 [Pluteus cervinus]